MWTPVQRRGPASGYSAPGQALGVGSEEDVSPCPVPPQPGISTGWGVQGFAHLRPPGGAPDLLIGRLILLWSHTVELDDVSRDMHCYRVSESAARIHIIVDPDPYGSGDPDPDGHQVGDVWSIEVWWPGPAGLRAGFTVARGVRVATGGGGAATRDAGAGAFCTRVCPAGCQDAPRPGSREHPLLSPPSSARTSCCSAHSGRPSNCRVRAARPPTPSQTPGEWEPSPRPRTGSRPPAGRWRGAAPWVAQPFPRPPAAGRVADRGLRGADGRGAEERRRAPVRRAKRGHARTAGDAGRRRPPVDRRGTEVGPHAAGAGPATGTARAYVPTDPTSGRLGAVRDCDSKPTARACGQFGVRRPARIIP